MRIRRTVSRPFALILSLSLLVSGLFINPSPVQAETPHMDYGSVYDVGFVGSSVGTEHWYALTMRQHEAFTISLDASINPGGELYLQFYDQDYHFLAEHRYYLDETTYGTDILDGERGTISYIADVAGTYYVKVSGTSTTDGYYDLGLYRNWYDVEATEQDAVAIGYSTARYVQNGNYAVSNADYYDTFVFSAQEGANVQASVKGVLNTGVLGVVLLDRDQNLIAEYSYVDQYADVQYDIPNGKTGTFSHKVEEAGIYYLVVYGLSEVDGYYTLTVKGADPNRDTDQDGLTDVKEYYYHTSIYDPDSDNDLMLDGVELLNGRYPTTAKEYTLAETDAANTLESALAIPYQDKAFKANFRESETWYKVDLAANEGVTVLTTSSLNEGDIQIQLFDASGTAVTDLGLEGWQGHIYGGQTIMLNYKASTGGTYYLKVTGDPGATGNYLMTFYQSWYNAGVTDHTRDFYSSFGTSRYLHEGSNTLGLIKQDFYHFTAKANSVIQIDVKPHLNSGWLYMSLYDQDHNLVASSQADGYLDTVFGNGETGSVFYDVAEAGTYYLIVEGFWDTTGTYELDAVSGVELKPAIAQQRLAGTDRNKTAVEVSKQGWPNGADAVVLARNDNYPDALAGAPLAYKYDAPILLTNKQTLTPATEAEIDRLGAKTVYILGSTGAISAEIEQDLKGKGLEVIRLGGNDRFATSAAIAEYMGNKGKAVLASGMNFPDALAVSSWAANQGVPILLTGKDSLPAATAEALENLAVTETIVVGGTGVISESVMQALPGATRYAGNNRYQTSIKVAQGLGSDTGTIYLATGDNFPDALAGSVLAARTNSPIILVDQNLTDGMTNYYLESNAGQISQINVLGGSGAIPQAVVTKAGQKVN